MNGPAQTSQAAVARVERGGSREALLDAAERLMGAQGYHAASVSLLCKESGCPNGSLYHHFGSKAGLLKAALQRGLGRLDDALQVASRDGGSGAARLSRFIDVLLETVDRHANFQRLLVFVLLEQTHDPEVQDVVDPFRSRILEQVTEVCADALGESSPVAECAEARDMALSLTGLTIGLFALGVPEVRHLAHAYVRRALPDHPGAP
ncbi:TetR/AcrR family transcriptional regulator [Streptomyces tailanensis]|uniref:TetR/AcrR family transcriptional regulator n=1 Tax=Streptomyces tailanensis TaxID=2569858 RepID=UPI00122E19BF|nr:TetR/AcrR family transcriptional regulator [Streptomyces tailanensis]